jgi:CheY-like chemotaxis protein
MLSLRLLIVEDDVASLELMKAVFASMKADVYSVHESGKAADLVSRERFDGILLDFEMPVIKGFDLVRWIRTSSWNRSTPIIIVTPDDRKTMEDVFANGATFYLQKPVNREKLTNLYQTVCQSRYECQRRFVRIPFQTNVVGTVGSRELKGMTWNLSEGGIQVDAEHLTPGQDVRLSFRLPSCGTQVDATGIVAWVGQKRQGIKFEHVKNLQAIRDLVSQTKGAHKK